jgi:hydroxyacylglutathione hydrolase
MYFKQFYLGCLAHASYLIGSEGEAAVIDPQRDVDQYLDDAGAQDLKIKFIIETHLHADFVSGHRELAALTGAEIVLGRRAEATFPHRGVVEGDELGIGNVVLRIMETPGHTPESISILVIDTEHSLEPQKVLTGDTLFIGDVGRPDLAGTKGFTSEQMASMLYDSLHGKLMTLGDEVEVFPSHGAGSMCGKNISKETSSTIGQQRQFNYALRAMPRDEFIRMTTSDLSQPPAYFPTDAEINRTGAVALSELSPPAPLTPLEVDVLRNQGYLVLDVRSGPEFGAGHVPGALNIGLDGQFASWAGTLIPFGTPLILVVGEESEMKEAVKRLARIGIDTVKGYLDGGMTSWGSVSLEERKIRQIDVHELHDLIGENQGIQIVDVRRPGEYAAGHVPLAVSYPLGPGLTEATSSLARDRATAVICAGGYRSSAAASMLARGGFRDLLNVTGGTGAWLKAGYEPG